MPKKKCQAAGAKTQQRAEEARRWVTTHEGQKAIASSLKQAGALTVQFKEAQRVSPERLGKPITL